ncbi:palmitoyltransferase ZDHHC16-like [Symsagittifera roscoffensis]|uniref:palmitoyltransferase ZDHHC16-like n=1 Tax=Symsagittifera roscoffensis TaxID=84072 RepID=UPI00307B45EE
MLFFFVQSVVFELKSLFYTSYYTYYNPADCFLDPFFNFFGRIIGALGYAFVLVGVSILSFEICLHYVIYLPLVLRTLDPFQILFHIIVGHWILANVSFNYFKCLTTNPGSPPNDSRAAKQIIGVCKRCIGPKPPRAHHCSVCKKCVLRMDHHCPWINNCVGHFNHKFFFSFLVYLIIGALYLVATAHFYFNIQFRFTKALRIFRRRELLSHDWYHSAISLHFGLAFISLLPVGFLFLQQAKLLFFGETVIEQYTNIRDRQRCKEQKIQFRNIYDYGWRNNIFLMYGVTQAEYEKDWSFLRVFLLPNSRNPIGDGLSWFPPDSPLAKRSCPPKNSIMSQHSISRVSEQNSQMAQVVVM